MTNSRITCVCGSWMLSALICFLRNAGSYSDSIEIGILKEYKPVVCIGIAHQRESGKWLYQYSSLPPFFFLATVCSEKCFIAISTVFFVCLFWI